MDIVVSDVEEEDIDKAFEKYRKTNNINNSQVVLLLFHIIQKYFS